MKPVILKFGGASVATPEHFLSVADLVIERAKTNPKLVVVVSAMGDATDQLLALARAVHPNPPRREQDMLVSVGERVSISLLAMALSLKGLDAISFTGSQSGIITNEDHTDAKIVDVRPERVKRALENQRVVIVAGFQGVSRRGEITTLGRGGSDTTAVALAIALESERVEFYKDVGGVFERDPKVYSDARILSQLSYERALSLADRGAEVLHSRSIQLAWKNGVQMHVFSCSPSSPVLGSVVGFNAVRISPVHYEAVESV